jgi:hypothetical protein
MKVMAIFSHTVEENKNSVSRCDAAGGIPRYGFMRRGEWQ